MKYIVVTGGVVSGLGKGVTISSMGRLLQASGLKVTAIKIDPYLNVDAGTMSPFEHGEVFVLQDGGESDLDLGNYERFLNLELTSDHNLTTGKVYRKVILAERRGDYLGKTVQVVPHITDCIQDWLEEVAHLPTTPGSDETADVCLIEVGGTVGDIESSVFLEALRQFQFKVGPGNFCLCFVSLVPVLSDEQKTKPTQHGVRDLRSLGLSPSIIFCRSTQQLQEATKSKISSFCHVPADNVLSVHDVTNVYHVPGLLESQRLHDILQEQLHLPSALHPDLGTWNAMARSVDSDSASSAAAAVGGVVSVALVGKYTGQQDSYLSVIKALRHASIACQVRLEIRWVEASKLVKADDASKGGDGESAADDDDATTEEEFEEAWTKLRTADGVIVPGGFGQRGWEGKIRAAEHCRTTGLPYLGVCLGFQAMVVEYCRNVVGWSDADSTEVAGEDKIQHPAIIFMPEIDKATMGGTMRLGSRSTEFTHGHADGSKATTRLLYGDRRIVWERHRHRYEVNPDVVDEVHGAGLRLVGRDGDAGERMEVAELPRTQHPYYVGVQFHPEFTSRPLKPSPPFWGLVLAASGQLDDQLASLEREERQEEEQEQENGVGDDDTKKKEEEEEKEEETATTKTTTADQAEF